MFEKEIEKFKAEYVFVREFLPKLKESLSDEKYVHSIGTMITSHEIMYALTKDASLVEKAALAGLLHDCAKSTTLAEMLEFCEIYGITKKDVGSMTPTLLHAPIGVFVAQRDYGITDIEVLNAIRYHTTGREKMTLLEKVVYISDVAEPTRVNDEHLSAEQLRAIIEGAISDMDKTLLESMNGEIQRLLGKGKFLNQDTVAARNALLG